MHFRSSTAKGQGQALPLFHHVGAGPGSSPLPTRRGRARLFPSPTGRGVGERVRCQVGGEKQRVCCCSPVFGSAATPSAVAHRHRQTAPAPARGLRPVGTLARWERGRSTLFPFPSGRGKVHARGARPGNPIPRSWNGSSRRSSTSRAKRSRTMPGAYSCGRRGAAGASPHMHLAPCVAKLRR
jgi:hypothetical protein